LVLNAFILVPARRAVCWDELRRLVGPVLLGLPVGAWVLAAMRPAPLKVLVGAVVIALALAPLAGFGGAPAPLAGLGAAAGFAGGILTTSINFNAPPVVLYLSTRGLDAPAFRATVAAYLMVAHSAAVAVFAAAGLLGRDVAALALGLAPGAAAGAWVGSPGATRLDTPVFGRPAPGVVLATGAAASLLAGYLRA